MGIRLACGSLKLLHACCNGNGIVFHLEKFAKLKLNNKKFIET
jgi:hypothetical protein